MISWARILCWLCLLLAPTALHAAAMDCKHLRVTATSHLGWPIHTLTDRETPTPGIYRHYPHYSHSCFTLENISHETLEFSVYLHSPRMQHAELYTELPEGNYSAVIGTDYPLPLWSTPGADAVFSVKLPPGVQSRHELMIGSKGAFSSHLLVLERNQMLDMLARTKHQAGLIAGIILILVAYFLCLAISTREVTYFHLAGSTLGVALMQLNELGLLYSLWPRALHWNQTASYFFAILSTLFGSCLARNYLDTRSTMPVLDRLLNIFSWYLLLICVPASLSGKHTLILSLFALPALLFMLTLLNISIIRIRQGFMPARLYLLAYILPLFAGIGIVLIALGWLPSTPTAHLLPLGATAIQLILFALALGERINWLNRERDAARLRTVQARTETESKRHFLAHISHELRTPLIGIIGLSELLDRRQYHQADIELIQGMEDSARHLLAITNTLLDHARLDAGKWPLHSETFAIAPMLDALLAQHRNAARDKQLTLTAHVDPDVPAVVHGPREILERILDELAGNAIKFTARGSVSVKLQLAGTETSPLLHISVKDTGIGFNEDFRNRMFEVFELADTSSTRQGQGSGLGLSLCRKLCLLLGSAIGCTSEPECGSEFWFTWPFTPASATALPAAPLQPARSGKILIAEDDEAIRTVLAAMLDKLGIQDYQLFCDGRALLDDYQADPAQVALVLLDWNMPIMGGDETVQALRCHEAGQGLPPVPIVVMTAHDAHQGLQDCLPSDIRLLHKPVSLDALRTLFPEQAGA